MDYSAANERLWHGILQFGIISAALLIAWWLYRRCRFLRRCMMPVAVCAGFLLLAARYAGLPLNETMMEAVVYHALALGFIASALRPAMKAQQSGRSTGIRSGAVIVSTYLLQGIIGLTISLALSYTFMPGLFRTAGMLLPMGFGQGPGQANNVGSMLEDMGFAGGRSFGLTIAAMGYLVACSVGVVMLNVLRRRGDIQPPSSCLSGDSAVAPVSEDTLSGKSTMAPVSLDVLSLQAAGVLMIYALTYLLTRGLTAGLAAVLPGVAKTVSSLIWGFNFITGSALAILTRLLLQRFGRENTPAMITHKNEILNRVSGICFDYMVAAGIASIHLEDIRGLWVPFLLMTVLGGMLTWVHLRLVCRKVYPDYVCQGLIAMFGMLTGTISSGVLLLREIDPDLSTPAANQLVVGSGFAIVLGAPMLVLISIAPRSEALTWITLGIMVLYLALMLSIIFFRRKKKP